MTPRDHLRVLLVLVCLCTIVVAVWLLERTARSSPAGVAELGVTGSANPRSDTAMSGDPVRRRVKSRYWVAEFRERWLEKKRETKMKARTIRRLRAELVEHRAKLRTLQAHRDPVESWADRQIQAAEQIAQESNGDPWPNCPDPYDGSGASWSETVNCENGGNWLDSPGFYRCGLQFHPMWERRFGALCP